MLGLVCAMAGVQGTHLSCWANKTERPMTGMLPTFFFLIYIYVYIYHIYIDIYLPTITVQAISELTHPGAGG